MSAHRYIREFFDQIAVRFPGCPWQSSSRQRAGHCRRLQVRELPIIQQAARSTGNSVIRKRHYKLFTTATQVMRLALTATAASLPTGDSISECRIPSWLCDLMSNLAATRCSCRKNCRNTTGDRAVARPLTAHGVTHSIRRLSGGAGRIVSNRGLTP